MIALVIFQCNTATSQGRTLARLATQQPLPDTDADIAALLTAEPGLPRKLVLLTRMAGIGLTTAVVLLAETAGLSLPGNERQRASYAGLAVAQRQRGTSARATTISRRGNVRLRPALYLPAISSRRCNPRLRIFYARLRARPLNGKPGMIAVMRKPRPTPPPMPMAGS